MKKGIAIFLAFVLLLGTFPLPVHAVEDVLEGAGTEENPYEIADADDLLAFAAKVNDDGEGGACAQLMGDIDLSGCDWTPIGSTDVYKGTFNGNGCTVSGFSVLADENWEYYEVGFFGTLKNATVKNLRLEGTVTVTEDAEISSVGALAAVLARGNTITNCKTDVTIEVAADTCGVGGVVGYVCDRETNVISGCTNWGDITGTYEDGTAGFGGIVGWTDEELTLNYCYNRGSISCVGDDSHAGGLIGLVNNVAPNITGCYTSASTDERGTSAPRWAELTGTISATYSGDFFGTAYEIETANHNMTFAEQIEGESGLYYGDYDICRALEFDTVNEALNYLNGDNEIYTFSENIGDGWPVLAWELEKSQSQKTPQEKAMASAKKAFNDEKDAALKALDAGKTIDNTKYVGYTTYKWQQEHNYSSDYQNKYNHYSTENWALLESIYKAAKKTLNSVDFVEAENWETMEPEAIIADGVRQQQTAGLTDIADTALKDMKDVPTLYLESQLAQDKLRAQQDVSTTYKKQLKLLDGYRGQLAAVWHELSGEAAAALEERASELDKKLDEAIRALEEAKTAKALAVTKTAENAKILAILADYSVPVIDSGVTVKWDGETRTQPSGNGTSEKPYQISNGAELAWFAQKVNGGTTSACAVLTADIDLNGKEWTPIGTKNKVYLGTFDGQNHIIHGIYSTSGDIQGMFGYIGRDYNKRTIYGTVKNVKAAGLVYAGQNNGSGLIAGNTAGEVYNCEVSAFLQNWKGLQNIGGIAGYLSGGSVESCRTWGLFQSNNESGYGGYIIGSIGGVVGHAGNFDPKEGCLIRYCENHLRISAYETSYLSGKGNRQGGIVGTLDNVAKVRECVNYADLRGGVKIGGIAGSATGSDISIAYVANYGDVRGAAEANPDVRGNGGILGYAEAGSTVEYAYNAGTIRGETDRNKINTDTECSPSAAMTGGIVGNWRGGSVNHVQSSSENTLWGYAEAAGTDCTDTARVAKITPSVNAKGGTWDKLTATRTLLGRLIQNSDRDSNYKVYGTQSALYNATVMDIIRKIELAENAEAIAAILRDGEDALASVPTELEATKAALRAEMKAYVEGNIYDADGQKEMNELLAQAVEALDAATDLSKVADIRQKYLGTENIDGLLKEVMTYPVKAANELYNQFVYGKKYAQKDMAVLLRAYEGWKLKLETARTFEEVENIYAEARKALVVLVGNFKEGSNLPDMDQAAQDALAQARQEILGELEKLEVKYVDALTQQVGDLSAVSAKWQKLLKDTLDAEKAEFHAAATPALEKITSYGELETVRDEAKDSMDFGYAKAKSELARLLASARNTAAWDGVTATEPQQKDGVYQIETPAELAWLALTVNKNNYNGKEFKAVLTADIDLGYCEWTPIGWKKDYSAATAFRGSFDGQGHTVSGLSVSEIGTGYVGLFGYAVGGASIKNLTVEGEISLTGINKTVCVGGLLGEGFATYVENCASRVKVQATFSGFGGRSSCIGGLIGELSGNKLTDCRFAGTATATYGPGSTYLGFNGGGLGGIVGYLKSGELKRCVNSGEVTADKASGVGGIIGANDSYSGTIMLQQCVNTGHISNDTAFAIAVGETPTGGVGGILGIANRGDVTIDSCYNTGVISGGIIAGGILGGESGRYGKFTTSGNSKLTVKNCYNTGLLDTGTKIDRIGALAGYPIEGQYRDNLYVLVKSARVPMGWKSSQGDCITVTDSLTANMFDGLIESIAGINGGYPIFPWQLLLEENREAVIDYLNTYYHTNIEHLILGAQRVELETMLKQMENTVNEAVDAQTICDIYRTTLEAMNPDRLLSDARAAVLDALAQAYEQANVSYPAIEQGLTSRYQADRSAIEQSASAADAEAVLDGFAANVVDLLVADAQEASMKELEQKATVIENIYGSLTETQQVLVQDYGKLSDIKALAKLYAKDRALLAQWGTEDAQAYPGLKEALEGLNAEALKGLDGCTKRETLTTILDGYCANVVELLIKGLDFTEGKTTMGELNVAADKLGRTRKALDGLSETQLALLGNKTDIVEKAEKLLADYQKAVLGLKEQCEKDQARYPAHAVRIAELAGSNAVALGTCVSQQGADDIFKRYCTQVAGLLAEQISKQPEESAEQPRTEATTEKPSDDSDTATKEPTDNSETMVAEVSKLIHAIGEVTLEKKDAIQKALEAYNALTEEQKALLSKDDKEILDAAVAGYRELLAAEEPSEDASGQKTDQKSEKENGGFDWSVVGLIVGILCAAALCLGLVRWFLVAKRSKEGKKR